MLCPGQHSYLLAAPRSHDLTWQCATAVEIDEFSHINIQLGIMNLELECVCCVFFSPKAFKSLRKSSLDHSLGV